MAKFKTGDIVQLKTRSPKMTVRGYSPLNSKEVACDWFVDSDKKHATFMEDQLEITS